MNRDQPLQFLSEPSFGELLTLLRDDEYQVLGPTVRDDAIVYAEIESIDDLPLGWTDSQEPGAYRLRQDSKAGYFHYAVGPHSWKAQLFPPRATLSDARLTDTGWTFADCHEPLVKRALLGVRACELAAIRKQDRIFLEGDYVDPIYKQRRDNLLIIAVQCTTAAITCFCASMGTGPACDTGFDLALTELSEGFLIESGSEAGDAWLAKLNTEPASEAQVADAHAAQAVAAEQQRSLNTEGVRDLLLDNLEHERWDHVAERCLSCTNCTMVCPTCFCTSVDEVSDLSGDHVERVRQWDSCFNWDFSYMNGGNVRDSIRARYRQWLTHKLSSWIDQFGDSGCVGCDRCITWCPVGIDLTEEVAAIRQGVSS